MMIGKWLLACLIVLCVPFVFGASQFNYSQTTIGFTCDYSVAGFCTTTNPFSYTLLPNATFVTNTSVYLYITNVPSRAWVYVTFHYNDSTSATASESTVSTTSILKTISNPYPGKLVDKIEWQANRTGTTDGVPVLTSIDFWTTTPTYNLSITLFDSVNQSNISGFCALFTTGTSITCSVSNATNILNASNRGWDSSNRSVNFETLLNSQEKSGNVTRFATVNGQYCAVYPWFTQSNYCTTSYFNTGCGISGTSFNYYCLVTDEISQRCLSVSMSQNSSKQTEAMGCYNTVVALNATDGGYGTLTEWSSPYDNRTGTPKISKNYTNDNAADSDARFIISLYNTYNNPSFTNTTLKNNARTRAQQMCIDLVRYNFVKTNKISLSNSSRNITYYPAGGGNAAASGITASSFMYSGYYGDYALALLACGVDSGNTTYYDIAEDVVENMLAAANWTTSTGFRVPPGRSFHWSSGTTPTATCDVICSPAYIDDPDGKRLTKICGAERLYRDANLSLHPNIAQYCSEWYAKVNTTAYATEWYANGTRKNSLSDSYDGQALATYLEMSVNQSNIGNRLNLTGTKFSTSTQTFDFTTCQGLYNPSFPIEVLGYIISPATLYTFGASGANSCSGGSGSQTVTNGGISITVDSPINNTNTTTSDIYINFTVYNNNVTGSISGGSLPQSVANYTFSTDPATQGFTLGSGWSWNSNKSVIVYNGSSYGGNLFGPNNSLSQYRNGYNISITFNSGNITNFKFHMNTVSGSLNNGKYNMEANNATHQHLKYDGGTFSQTNNYINGNNITIDIFTNISANTTRACVRGGSCTNSEAASLTAINDYFGIQSGQVANSQLNISRIEIWNIGQPYNLSSGGSEHMNVTLYNGTGALLYAQNNTVNATLISYHYGTASGVNSYYINVRSAQNNVYFGNFTYTVYDSTTSYNYCTVGTVLTHNNSGIYDILLYNITGGGTTPRYYNLSLSQYNYNVSNGTYWSQIRLNTYEALIDLRALRLFLNTTIQSFLAQNDKIANSTTSGNFLIPARNGTNNIQINVSGNYSINISCSVSQPLGLLYCNATGIYDSIFYLMSKFSGSVLSNFSVDLKGNVTNTSSEELLSNDTTTAGLIMMPALQGYTYRLFANSSGYALSNTSITNNEAIEYYNFTMLIQNTFELYIKNETSNELLNKTVYLQLISDDFAANYTTSTGNITISLLTPTDYTIHYWYDEEVKRDYYTTLTQDTFQNLTLYLVDTEISDFYIPVVSDERGRRIEDATIKLLRYYIDCNCYRIVEMSKTDTNGQAVIRVVPNTINYKLIITKDDFSVETTPAKITSNTGSYTLSLKNNPLTHMKKIGSVSRSFRYNNETNTYIYTWDDSNGLITGGCLSITKYKEGTETTEYSGCSNGATGSIIYTLTDLNESRYVGNAYLTTNTDYSIDVESPIEVNNISNQNVFGAVGLIITLLVFLAIVFASVDSGPAATVIGGLVAIIVMAGIGFFVMPWASLVGIIIIGVIIVYKLRS